MERVGHRLQHQRRHKPPGPIWTPPDQCCRTGPAKPDDDPDGNRCSTKVDQRVPEVGKPVRLQRRDHSSQREQHDMPGHSQKNRRQDWPSGDHGAGTIRCCNLHHARCLLCVHVSGLPPTRADQRLQPTAVMGWSEAAVAVRSRRTDTEQPSLSAHRLSVLGRRQLRMAAAHVICGTPLGLCGRSGRGAGCGCAPGRLVRRGTSNDLDRGLGPHLNQLSVAPWMTGGVTCPGLRSVAHHGGATPEVVAMFAWGRVEASPEGSVHGLGCSEATGLGDLFDAAVGGLQ